MLDKQNIYLCVKYMFMSNESTRHHDTNNELGNFGLIVSQKYIHEIDPYINNVKTSRPAFCLLR